MAQQSIGDMMREISEGLTFGREDVWHGDSHGTPHGYDPNGKLLGISGPEVTRDGSPHSILGEPKHDV